MTLTDIKCKNAKPKQKPYRLAAGGGLYILNRPDLEKEWLFERCREVQADPDGRLADPFFDTVNLKPVNQGPLDRFILAYNELTEDGKRDADKLLAAWQKEAA